MGVVNFRTLNIIFLTIFLLLVFQYPRMISEEISLPCLSFRFTDKNALIDRIINFFEKTFFKQDS